MRDIHEVKKLQFTKYLPKSVRLTENPGELTVVGGSESRGWGWVGVGYSVGGEGG